MDKISKDYLLSHDIDAVGVGIIDFNNSKYKTKTYQKINDQIVENSNIYFDLASLTKILTNSAIYLKYQDKMTFEDRLLIEHRAGLPSWGLLSRSTWKEQILSYEIKETQTLYSDFSALRFMLEIQKKLKIDYKLELSSLYDKDLKHWLDLDILNETVQNGYVNFRPNLKSVHDPNAYNIKEFLSHAGLFSTTDGLAQTIVNFNKELDLINKVQSNIHENRYVLGWDRVQGISTTTAGEGCSNDTFGHLGFTGTSIWIDPIYRKGIIILTNTTKHFWNDRKDLNNFRKKLGEITWKQKDLSLDSYFY